MRTIIIAALAAAVLAVATGCGSEDALTLQQGEEVLPRYTRLVALCHQAQDTTRELNTLDDVYSRAGMEAVVSPYPFVKRHARDLYRRIGTVARQRLRAIKHYGQLYPYNPKDSLFMEHLAPRFEKAGLPFSIDPTKADVDLEKLDCP